MSAKERIDISELLDRHDGEAGAAAVLALACHSIRAILSVLPASDTNAAVALRDALERVEHAKALFRIREKAIGAAIQAAAGRAE